MSGAELMQSGSKFGHLLFDILVLVGLLFQLLFHLVERLHHVLLLLSLCVTLTLLLLKLLLQLVVLFPHFLCLLFPLFDLVFINQHPDNVLHVKILQWRDVGVVAFVVLQDHLLDDTIQQQPVLHRVTTSLMRHEEAVMQDRHKVWVCISVVHLLADEIKNLGGTFGVYVYHLKAFCQSQLILVPQHLKVV